MAYTEMMELFHSQEFANAAAGYIKVSPARDSLEGMLSPRLFEHFKATMATFAEKVPASLTSHRCNKHRV